MRPFLFYDQCITMKAVWIILFSYVGVTVLCGHVYSSTGNEQCSPSETCPTNCESCTADGTCCACSAGWHGDTCNQHCHGNCYTCSRSGECDTCNSSNVFGPLCDQPCALCIEGLCDRAQCTRGCVEGYFHAPIHDEPLPAQTNYYTCVKCPVPCTSCTSTSQCTSCIDKRWGIVCDERCPNHCKTCNRETGKCLYETCAYGQYRDNSGRCQSCPEHCRSCDSQSRCTECIGERHGDVCEKVDCKSIPHCTECSCPTDRCGIGDIVCDICDNGYTGNTCENKGTMGDDLTTARPASDHLTSEDVPDNTDNSATWVFQGKTKPHSASEVLRWVAVIVTIGLCLLALYFMFVYRVVVPLLMRHVRPFWRSVCNRFRWI